MLDTNTLIGLIWMFVLGPAVGNYACSVIYRLPRGRTPFDQHPFCGHCGAALQPKDLFPIFSWLSTRGKCRYCQGPIPGIYTVVEIACMLLFMGAFLLYGVGEEFLLLASLGTFVIILAAIEWQEGWLSSSIYGYAFAFAALYRTLQEGSIFSWTKDYIIMMAFGMLLAALAARLKRTPFKPFEVAWPWWLGLMVVVAPMPTTLMLFLAIAGLPLSLRPTRLSAPLFAFSVISWALLA